MPEFQSAADIGNRALQHCGAVRMDATLGFAENSKNAAEVAFCYGKLRTAELRRNTWRFATRRAILRAVDTNTMLVTPTLWSSTATYFVGSIAADGSGNLWISNTANNLGNDPQNTTVWEPYFGPLTVSLYDSTTTYFSGELVYTAAGDGTYNTWLSLVNQNALHPALPNEWSASTVYQLNQVVIVWPAWAVGTTYTQGQTVTYTDGNVYSSLTNGNIGNAPALGSASWALVPVLVLASQQVPASTQTRPPSTSPVIEWSQITTYAAAAVVMFNGSLYLAVAGGNTGQFPNAAASAFWVKMTGGALSMSLIALNLGNNPASAPALWASGTTYALNNLVGGSDGVIYKSLAGGNVGHDPTLDAGVHWQNTGTLNPWTTVFTQGGGNEQWTQIGGALFPSGVGLTKVSIVYPISTGPSTQTSTRNVFRLPNGFLRQAPSDPKAGSFSYVGAPSNLYYDDWVLEGDYLVSSYSNPIMFRFVADVTDVRRMDPMFCEGLAARIGLEVCEPLTQSTAKIGMIAKIYEKWIGDARTVNGIEVGAEEPPLDDYIACRY